MLTIRTSKFNTIIRSRPQFFILWLHNPKGWFVADSEVNPDGPRADQSREVAISSGNQSLARCAFVGANQKDEFITSGLLVTRQQSL
jgi:hypothetical protein